jgi:signal peptidase I
VTVVRSRTRPKHAAPRQASFWRELPILLGVAILVALVVRVFLVQTFWVPSTSMVPTLQVGDRVLVNKLVFHVNSPSRGEVVVFNSPISWRSFPNETVFIKRLIGLPGDHVMCCDANGELQINGKSLREPYLNFTESAAKPAAPQPFNIVVPPDRLWVMGDNRYNSGDSAANWYRSANVDQSTIRESALIGRAFLLFWPLTRFDWLTVPSTFDKVPSG